MTRHRPQGDLIEVGFFSNTGGISSLNTAAQNLANFTSFGTGLMGDNLSLDGYFAEVTSAPAGSFSHAQIFVVALNDPTVAGATQMGAWSVDLASDSNFRFPAESDIPNSTSFDMDEMSSAAGTPNSALSTGAHIWFGTGPGTDSAAGLALEQVVPEPSTMALIVMGLFGTIGMIRRRRS